MDELLVETYPLSKNNTNNTPEGNISLRMNRSGNLENVKNFHEEFQSDKYILRDNSTVNTDLSNISQESSVTNLYDDIDSDVVKNSGQSKNTKPSDSIAMQNKFPSISLNLLKRKPVSHESQSVIPSISPQTTLNDRLEAKVSYYFKVIT